ncbi:ATP-binding protein [Streptomyces sp. CAU 1734]|uniref:ATP-binding protein n=1 Tax=Streptomyces sp. CAU 1734 TaxID=3140360 RepID=UPI0032616682
MTTHVSASSSTSVREGSGGRAAVPGPVAGWPLRAAEAIRPPWGAGQGLGATGFAACGLDGNLRNAPQARRFVAATLDGWALRGLADDAGLVVSELVTNAVQHAVDPAAPDNGEYPVWLGIFLHPHDVVCAVTDPSPVPPRPRDAEFSALGGRGLALIQAVSRNWSWSLTPPRGKTVWAALPRESAPGR